MTEFRMPSLGADMEQGTLLEWLVHPGDQVRKGQVVAVVDTDKSAVEVECFTDGIVKALLVEPGTTVAVGTPLAVLDADGEVAGPLSEPAVVSPLVRHEAARDGVDLRHVHGTGPGGAVRRADLHPPTPAQRSVPAAAGAKAPAAAGAERTRVSPYARRLAHERELDLAAVRGSGSAGEVRARDLPEAAPSPTPPGGPTTQAPTDPRAGGRLQVVTAALMTRSKREIPHYYLKTTIDLDAAVAWLRATNLERTVAERLVPAALLLTATARAAAAFPELNASWQDGGPVRHASVHLGVAVSLRAGGTVAPAIHEAQALSPSGMMSALRDVVSRARSGRLRNSELTDATLTVTNLGDQGVEEVFGVIYPPQVALVGFGKVVDRPCAVDGLLGVRPGVSATLSADHRASDGAVGARFLSRIARFLQHPEAL